MKGTELERLELLQCQLGRLTAIVAKLHVLEGIYGVDDKLRMGLELVKLADELGAPMSDETRGQIRRRADACDVALPRAPEV